MTQLRHKGCGGTLLLDISGMVALITPSYNFSLHGNGIGTVELSKRTSPISIGQSFVCSKCSESVPNAQVEGQCVVCRKYHSPGKLYITEAVPLICGDCFDALGETPPEKMSTKVAEYRAYVTFPSGTQKKSLLKTVSETISV